MKRLKVMTIVGTRPEIIRLSQVIKSCDRHFHHILVHTGQNWDYTLNEIFFRDLEIRKPDYFLEAAGRHLGDTVGNIMARSYEVLMKEMPDSLLILGDTNSALCAIMAKRLKIPVFHMEAGNRCFDQNVPEEINRKIVDHVSDINMPYTEHGRRYLLSEGFRRDHIIVTGSPMREVIMKNREKIEASEIMRELSLEKDRFIVVSAHREENIDHEQNFQSLMTALNRVAGHYKLPVIYSAHPRTRNKIDNEKISFDPLVRILKPFGYFDFNKLQQNAFCVLSDSGTLSEESALMNFPAVLIRTSTERPEVLEKGSMIIGGINGDSVLQSVEMARDFSVEKNDTLLPHDYQDENVSTKVVKIIQSYTRIIDRVTWNRF